MTRENDISTICELFQNMEYGEEKTGGSAGSFLRLQFYEGDLRLGEILLKSPSTMQYVDGNRVIVLPIAKGAWSVSRWDAFIDQLPDN